MHFRIIFFISFISLNGEFLQGQTTNSSSIKKARIEVKDCSVVLDSNSVLPSSVLITMEGDAIKAFSIQNNLIIFEPLSCRNLKDKIIDVSYRSFNFNIERQVFNIDSSILEFKEIALIKGYEYIPNQDKNKIIESVGLDYKGSFSRGLSVGNSQSLVLNSNFDMQLIGDLGNGLKVVAAISDENLPIQAQGNTQQLQEFDKVFIQVSKDRTSITAGDYELRRPNSYFMNYFKKLKGVTLATTIKTTDKTEVFSKGSFAISRGKFARQTVATKEGNQGPYRLQGNNGERFIIVLAGTEKIYFNGNLLVRGYDNDYVIDYNRAEITFSPTRVVARDSRVIIEFEYTDISYLRSLYAGQSEYKGPNWNVNFNFYSEQDSKSSTGDIQLDSTDIRILNESGDEPLKSVRNSLRMVSDVEKLEATRILYKGVQDPTDPNNIILIFTTNIDSAQYSAVFTEVGAGKGDYVIDNTQNKNARVYLYQGKNQGTYLPIVQLIPPEQKQLITTNGTYHFSKKSNVFAELGLSNLDKNRRSDIQNEDNVGYSSHVAFTHEANLDTTGNWQLKGVVKHEYISRDFNALNPFRVPEFTRDWNISQLNLKGAENLIYSNFTIKNKGGFNVNYGYNQFDKTEVYNGKRHEMTLGYVNKNVEFRFYNNILNSDSKALDQNTTFSRPNVKTSYIFEKNKKWKIGAEYDGETNKLKNNSIDSLLKNSYSFSNTKVYVSNDPNADFGLKLSYAERNDYFANKSTLVHAANAKEIEIAGKWTASENSDLQWNVIGRSLKVIESELLPNDQNKNTILGRVDYSFSALNRGISSTTSYNTNSGQEPRIEYIFQKVDVGRGDYFLITESENPNLSNVQDFRYDPTNPLSSYIRLTLTNNEFIRTNNIEINQNFNIDASKFSKPVPEKPRSEFYKFYSRFSSLSNIRVSKKQLENSKSKLSSFIDFGISDTSLVAYNALNTNTIFFNRGNVKYDIQAGSRNNKNRIIQVNGREDRGLEEYFIRSRWNIKNKADLFLVYEKAIKTYHSEAFGDRNLDIQIYKIKPEFSFRPSQNTRINIKYSYQSKKQEILSLDQAKFNEFTSEFAIRKANKYSVDLSISYVNISFTGLPNSPIEYDLLEGLKNGKNYLWNILYTKRLAKNIDLTINYEGRKTGVSPLINVGRAQIKASF